MKLNFNQSCCRTINKMELETSWCKTAIGERLIVYHEKRLWNALPLELRMADLENFKKKLMTLFFNDYDKLKKEAFNYNS